MMHTDFVSALYNVLKENNFHIKGNINFGTEMIQRFQDVRKPKGKDLFIVLHDGRGATFGDWHDRDGWITWWLNEKKQLSISENQEYKEQRKEMEKQRENKRFYALKRAQNFWHTHASHAAVYEHPYVIKKRIRPYYSKVVNQRWIRDALIIPIRDIDYNLMTIQLIKANGFKRVWKGTSHKYLMMWLSLPLPENYDDVIRICEGYATGCAIYESIGDPVICGINLENMKDVTLELRRKYPKAILKICADNDQWNKINGGLKVAKEICLLTGATLYYPDFSKLDTSSKPTDFNDLFCSAGVEETERQLTLIRSLNDLS